MPQLITTKICLLKVSNINKDIKDNNHILTTIKTPKVTLSRKFDDFQQYSFYFDHQSFLLIKAMLVVLFVNLQYI